MNITKTLVSGFAAVALVAVGVHAQEIDSPSGGVNGYSSGDLLLAFYSQTAPADLLFDIGTGASYQGLAAGTYNVAGFTGSATAGQPAVGSGNTDYLAAFGSYSASTRWSVSAGNSGTSELYLTSQGATQKANTANIQGGTAGTIDTIGAEAQGNPNTAGANPGDSLLTDKPVFNGISSTTHTWAGGEQVVDTTTAGTSTLTLWYLAPTSSGTKNGVDLGFFTLNGGNGTLTFTVIPEPATYAAILGALTVGFVMVRRRFRSAGFSAAA